MCVFQYPLRVEVGCNWRKRAIVPATSAFQYPLQVEVGCNRRVSGNGEALARVSVPSTGRSGLQRGYTLMKKVGYEVSVPSTGRSGLQHRPTLLRSGVCQCFSTLYGSKWVATVPSPLDSIPGQEFQYPLRVEVGCNDTAARRRNECVAVSVPSTGRSGLQLRCALRQVRECCVSVPSTGRSGLQLQPLHKCRRVMQVSVPSTGRSGLQHLATSSVTSGKRCFSTLYGSKWVATWLKAYDGSVWSRFQYPLRVEVGCNLPSLAFGVWKSWFQYPLRVEVGCNLRTFCKAFMA